MGEAVRVLPPLQGEAMTVEIAIERTFVASWPDPPRWFLRERKLQHKTVYTRRGAWAIYRGIVTFEEWRRLVGVDGFMFDAEAEMLEREADRRA